MYTPEYRLLPLLLLACSAHASPATQQEENWFTENPKIVARLNLRTGQPWIRVNELDMQQPTLPLRVLRFALSPDQHSAGAGGATTCTWGHAWCAETDFRLQPDGAGGYHLMDCCTGIPVHWVPVAGALSTSGTLATWRSAFHPDARLTRLASGGFELRWGSSETDLVEIRHADGRLIQLRKAPAAGTKPVTVDHEWSESGPGKPHRLKAMRHSDGATLQFDWGAQGRLSALRVNGEVKRTYRYNDAGWLMAAADDAAPPSGWQYRYTVRGELLSWPGGRVWRTPMGWGDMAPERVRRWEEQGCTHQAQETKHGHRMDVVHQWQCASDDAPKQHVLQYQLVPDAGWVLEQRTAKMGAGEGWTAVFNTTTGRLSQWTLVKNGETTRFAYAYNEAGRAREVQQGQLRMTLHYTPTGEWSGVTWAGGRYQSAQFGLDARGGIISIKWTQAGQQPKQVRIQRDASGDIVKLVTGKQTSTAELMQVMAAITDMYPLAGLQSLSDLSVGGLGDD